MALDQQTAAHFATVALGHVTREYPNHLTILVSGPLAAVSPRALHPVFYGSLDWHSCVHGYWLLARIARRFPGLSQAKAIARLFDDHLTAGAIAGETDYFTAPAREGFERPYGWAWLLALAAELHGWDDPKAARWRSALQPLADLIAKRFATYLPKQPYPVRAGAHTNSAFALYWLRAYANRIADARLAALAHDKALEWYSADAGAQAWEPSGDDFLSPLLMEALCMESCLTPSAFQRWFGAFLPDIAAEQPAVLFAPALVSDRSDGKIAHLDGLNLTRAWCWRSLAKALPADDPRAAPMRAAADRHLAASLPHIAADYAGEHWLATMALLALEADD
jgi:Protein of unknown function (DUF2891)